MVDGEQRETIKETLISDFNKVIPAKSIFDPYLGTKEKQHDVDEQKRPVLSNASGEHRTVSVHGRQTTIAERRKHTQQHLIRQRLFFGAIMKKIFGSMSSSHMPSSVDTLAPGNSVKNRATASLSSSLARWTPRHTVGTLVIQPGRQVPVPLRVDGYE